MTRILIAGDWHGHTTWMEKALRSAHRNGFSTIIHVGDLAVLWPAPNDQDKFTKVLKKRLDEYGITLIFVDGNHDVHPRLRALPLNADGFGVISDRLLYAPRGHRWELEGIRFAALGGAYSVDRSSRKLGSSWWEGEEVHPADVARLGHEPLDVLITHEVPAGVDVRYGFTLPDHLEFASYESRRLVREAVRTTRPRLVFSGHWHQRISQPIPYTPTHSHILHRDGFEGNLVSLDLEDLSVREYSPERNGGEQV